MSANRVFRFKVDIYYEDTDCGGVVYYANYLKYFERARTGALVDLGFDPVKLSDDGIVFAVTKAQVEYRRPAKYGDRLMIETMVSTVRSARLSFEYAITRESDRELIVTGRTDLACVNERMKPRRIPGNLVKTITEQNEN